MYLTFVSKSKLLKFTSFLICNVRGGEVSAQWCFEEFTQSPRMSVRNPCRVYLPTGQWIWLSNWSVNRDPGSLSWREKNLRCTYVTIEKSPAKLVVSSHVQKQFVQFVKLKRWDCSQFFGMNINQFPSPNHHQGFPQQTKPSWTGSTLHQHLQLSKIFH